MILNSCLINVNENSNTLNKSLTGEPYAIKMSPTKDITNPTPIKIAYLETLILLSKVTGNLSVKYIQN